MSLPSLVKEDDAFHLSRDARVVAVRWDLLEWGVVIDLDTPISEAAGAAMQRAWLVFDGVAEMTIPMDSARLPNGIWLTSSLTAETDREGFRVYTCQALLPTFDGTILRSAKSSGAIRIRAQGLTGVTSNGFDTPSNYGLSFEARDRLCTDRDMLNAVTTK